MPYSRRSALLRLLPLVLPVGGLFLAGAMATFAQSFGALSPLPGAKIGWDAWITLFSNNWILSSVFFSLAIALSSATLSVILGTILAWRIHQLPGPWRSLAMTYKIPLILPHLTVAYLTVLLFGQSGVLSSWAAKLGWIQEIRDFPNLLYGGYGIGVALAYVMKETSFVALMASGMLLKLDDRFVLSARMLGASRFAVFRDIVLPHLRPVLVSSFLILTLYALGGFEIPWLIGESRPQMLSITAYDIYFRHDLSRRPEAAALLGLLMLLSTLLIPLTFVLLGKKTRHE